MKKFTTILVFFQLFFCCKISAFTFHISVTPETCPGNGQLIITFDQSNASASYLFEIYKVPNLTNPLLITSNSTITGLNDGNYQLIVKENLASVISSQNINFTILDTTTELDFQVSSLLTACSSSSNLQINTISGSPVSYEIISGPVIRPLQSSNLFANLPLGTYQIRVVDSCGNALVKTHTLVTSIVGLNANFIDSTLINCSQSQLTLQVTPALGSQIAYPLVISISYSQSGQISSSTYTLSNGAALQALLQLVLPNEVDNSAFNISVIDNCNTHYNFTTSSMPVFTTQTSVFNLPCNQYYFTTTMLHGLAPFHYEFIDYPNSFNPNNYVGNFNGVVSDNSITFGSNLNPIPSGFYTILVTDQCGQIYSETFELPTIEPVIDASGYAADCLANTGIIKVEIPFFGIQSASILDAPPAFTQLLPYDVTSFIMNNSLELVDMPIGTYTLNVVNLCTGLSDVVTVTIPVYTNKGVTKNVRNGCSLGVASLFLKSNNSPISEINILQGPNSFSPIYPVNVSIHIINSGEFVIDGLTPGTYLFNVKDQCTFENSLTIEIEGYSITNNSFSMIENCGSFDLELQFQTNVLAQDKYWLQKLVDPVNQVWGHPISEIPYSNGLPDSANSLILQNNSINYNFSINGTFRIVHSFISYESGQTFNSGIVSSIQKSCIEIKAPQFTFNESLEIIDAYSIPCSDSSYSVVLNALGTPPLHYSIVALNGAPLNAPTQLNSIFINLLPGVYTFAVEDDCGNRVQQIYNLVEMPSLLYTFNPPDLHECIASLSETPSFNLSSQNSIILGAQNSALYSVFYYRSLSDLTNNINAIQNVTNFIPSSVPFVIYAKVFHNSYPDCYQIINFNLQYHLIPKLNLNTFYQVCDIPFSIDLTGQNSNTTLYTWSTGIEGPLFSIQDIGLHTVTVTATNTYPNTNFQCQTSQTFTVQISKKPKIASIKTLDWTWNDKNSLEIIMESDGEYLFSIDGIHFNPSSIFNNLSSGHYTLWAQDINGCGFDMVSTELLNYPHYFTPNGDNIQDEWKLFNMEGEPELIVEIYDCFGKFLYSMTGNKKGWDGNYEGKMMPATDYWFVVYRKSGLIHKGHFSLKR